MNLGMPSIVFIGTGNVAYHLSLNLQVKGCHIIQLIGRNYEKTSGLAKLLNVDFSCSVSDIVVDADLYILAVNDDAIPGLIAKLPSELKFVVHTSGSTSLSVFKHKFPQYGVFYPLQTISRIKDVDFSSVPFLLECSDIEGMVLLKELAWKISDHVLEMDSEHRGTLHVAAVFANNFSNFMLTVSNDILESEGMSFDLLRPMLQETFSKIQQHSPKDVQTGPAIRNDKRILDEHFNKLEKYPIYQKLYTFVSRNITDFYKGLK